MQIVLYIAIAVVVFTDPIAWFVRDRWVSQAKGPWSGGNDCNLVKFIRLKSPCCISHDKAYFEGGGYKDKWRADAALFMCLWNQNWLGKIFAIPAWVFVNRFGSISFQYGPKREALTK